MDEREMDKIIIDLLSANNDRMKLATAELEEAYRRPETLLQLSDIVVLHKEPQVRQYSAVILRKRLQIKRHFQMLSPLHETIIQTGMLTALKYEQVKAVCNAIAQVVGVVTRHCDNKNMQYIREILQYVYEHCSSTDPKDKELGSSVFTSLADVAPEMFVPHIESVCEMFTASLTATETSGDMSSSFIFNILSGMTYLVPFVFGHNFAEHTFQQSMPLIIKSLQAFAVHPNPNDFADAFSILDSMAHYIPKLLTANINQLLDFCWETSKNTNLNGAVRVKTDAFIGWLERLQKKLIKEQKLIESNIQVVLNLMEAKPKDDNNGKQYSLGEHYTNSQAVVVTQIMDLLALNSPAEKFVPPLLQLLEPALQGQDPLPRRAAYMSIAVIAEGFSEAICSMAHSNDLPIMLNFVNAGITDPIPVVRIAAFFALGQLLEHMQPDISKFAPQILPIFFEFLQQFSNEPGNASAEPKYINRMFFALRSFCDNLKDALIPHLPLLMERLFEAMNPKNSVRFRELALSAISAAANAAKENMLPYFQQLFAMLQTHLIMSDNEDILALRSQAIDTLAAIVRTIGKQNFMPLATETMICALLLLAEADGPNIRRALYNLIGSLAEVLNEEKALVCPLVVNKVYASLRSTDKMMPELKQDVISVPDVESADFIAEILYFDEIVAAILALKKFAQHTGDAFLPHLEQSFKNVYDLINHPQEDIRKVSIDTLVTLVIALYRQNIFQGVFHAVNILMPKLKQIVHDDKEVSVVLTALESFSKMLKDLEQAALPNEQICGTICICINDVLLGKTACQFDEPSGGGDAEVEENEYEESIIERACNLLPLFGLAMTPEKFSIYFGRIYPKLLQKLQKSQKDEDSKLQRAFVYGALAECCAALKTNAGMYFEALCPIMIDGLLDKFHQARQNAAFGLGELVLNAEEKSYNAFPHILMALSQASFKERERSPLDNICGALARVITTNCSLVPLDEVFPVLLQHLPLQEDFDENSSIVRCFTHLYVEAHDTLVASMEQVLAVASHVLHKKEYSDEETFYSTLRLFTEIRETYPDKFNKLANSNLAIYAFLQKF